MQEDDHIILNSLNDAPSNTTHHVNVDSNHSSDQPVVQPQPQPQPPVIPNITDDDNYDNFNMLDSYSLFLVGKYFESYDDFVNAEKTCKKYRGITKEYKYNPIPLEQNEINLFPNIQTFNLYDGYDSNPDSDSQHIITDLQKKNKSIMINIYEDDNKTDDAKYAIIKEDPNYQIISIKTGKLNLHMINNDNVNDNVNVLTGIDVDIPTGTSEIVIPYHITKIAEDCFNPGNDITDFSQNLRSIFIPKNVKMLGSRAFYNCYITHITLPNTIPFIPESCFAECSKLKNITLPNSIQYIDDTAFYNCSELKNIILPDSVGYLGKRTFMRCSRLTSIQFTSNLYHIGDGCFAFCGLKYFYLDDDITTYSIDLPSTITEFEDTVFWNCENIINVRCNTSKVPDGCFSECKGITSIRLLSNVTEIDGDAFYECTRLRNIDLPLTLKSIGRHAFEYCSSLTSINIPYKLKYIHDDCFHKSSFIEVKIPENLRNIISQNIIQELGNKIKWTTPTGIDTGLLKEKEI